MKTKLLVSSFALAFSSMTPVRLGDGTPELEIAYDSADDIPAGFEGLYSEKDGKHVLTRVKGLKTSTDVERLQTALTKERNDHKTAKQQLSTLTAHGTVDEIIANLDRIPELEAKQGKGDPADIEKIVAARLTPLQRELKTTQDSLAEKDKLIDTYKGKETKATIGETVRKAAKALKVRDSAVEDAIMYGERVLTIDESGNVVTKENAGVTPFITADELLREILPNRAHWLEESVGGGAGGGKGGDTNTNPYTHDNWDIGAQMKLYKENPDKARKMAERLGVDPMNPKRPAKKS